MERYGAGCGKDHYKFVGFLLDEFLSWDTHIKRTASKLASGNYAIARAKNFLPLNIRKTIYNSLFKCHLDYGLIAWGGAQPGKLKQISILQKKCIRNVANRGSRSHTDPLFKNMEILKFGDLYSHSLQSFMHEVDLEKVPPSFTDMFITLTNAGIRTNRHTALNYKVNHPKNNSLSRFPSVRLPEAWNSLPIDLKLMIKKEHFKDALKWNALSKYNETVFCGVMSCPDCYPE